MLSSYNNLRFFLYFSTPEGNSLSRSTTQYTHNTFHCVTELSFKSSTMATDTFPSSSDYVMKAIMAELSSPSSLSSAAANSVVLAVSDDCFEDGCSICLEPFSSHDPPAVLSSFLFIVYLSVLVYSVVNGVDGWSIICSGNFFFFGKLMIYL